MSWKRIIYFYKLNLFREEILHPEDAQATVNQIYYSNNEIGGMFNRIYPSEFTHNGNFNAIVLEPGNNQVTFEVLDVNQSIVFARIGRINDSNTIQLRNIQTLQPDEINRGANQGIETYTYLVIDFNTCIISYIGIQGAPGINKLWHLFEDHITGTHAEIIPIVENDVLNIIRHKRAITNVKLTVALPSDSILGMDNLGVDRADFDAIRHLKHQTISVILQAERDQSLFQNTNPAINVINGVMRRFPRERIKEIVISAKDPGENIQPYDILQHEITKKVSLTREGEGGGTLTMQEIGSRLVDNYNQSRENLTKNCR